MLVESIEKESVKFSSILFSIEVVNFGELNYFILDAFNWGIIS